MKVKIFDYPHEHDLEVKVNEFLSRIKDCKVIDIKYAVACTVDHEQIYCFSCLILYEETQKNDPK